MNITTFVPLFRKMNVLYVRTTENTIVYIHNPVLKGCDLTDFVDLWEDDIYNFLHEHLGMKK